jgi:hypothetical protein
MSWRSRSKALALRSACLVLRMAGQMGCCVELRLVCYTVVPLLTRTHEATRLALV